MTGGKKHFYLLPWKEGEQDMGGDADIGGPGRNRRMED